MKVNLVYPKIPENTNGFLNKCIAFEKYDGTNMHWIWSREEGWHLFGTRRTQFSLDRSGMFQFRETHPELASAPYIFNEKLRDKLTMFLCKHSIFSQHKITLFTEFYGSNSFAGGHDPTDEHELIIIDVMLDGNLLGPESFIQYFEEFGIAKVIYKGKYTGQFTEDVRNGKYNVIEGVVCKGIVESEVFMTKVKTKEYLKRLKNR